MRLGLAILNDLLSFIKEEIKQYGNLYTITENSYNDLDTTFIKFILTTDIINKVGICENILIAIREKFNNYYTENVIIKLT